MTKSLLILATASVLSAAAHAEDPAPPAPLTANVAVTTNYKYRGQDQGSLPSKAVKPAIQGGFDWTMNGFYIGNWNSSVGWLSGNSSGAPLRRPCCMRPSVSPGFSGLTACCSAWLRRPCSPRLPARRR